MIRWLIERIAAWWHDRDAQRRRRAREARLAALHVAAATPPPVARQHRDFFRRSARHG